MKSVHLMSVKSQLSYIFLYITEDILYSLCWYIIRNSKYPQFRPSWYSYETSQYGRQKDSAIKIIKNNINLLFVLGKSGGNLGFHPQCNVSRSCLPHHYVRHTWRHYDRHQSHKSVSNMSKNGTDWSFNFGCYPQCKAWGIFWTNQYVRHTWKPNGRH